MQCIQCANALYCNLYRIMYTMCNVYNVQMYCFVICILLYTMCNVYNMHYAIVLYCNLYCIMYTMCDVYNVQMYCIVMCIV